MIETNVGPWKISMMELFCENSQRFLAVNYFHKKDPSYIFDRVLNMPEWLTWHSPSENNCFNFGLNLMNFAPPVTEINSFGKSSLHSLSSNFNTSKGLVSGVRRMY